VVLEAPRRRLIAAAAVALLLAGCGGSDAGRVQASRLAQLVLAPGDLPAAFTQFDGGRQVRIDAVSGPRKQPERFGREGGWKARYNRPGAKATRGPLVVESRADVFKSADGAGDDLDAYRKQLEAEPGARLVDPPELADEAVASTSLQVGGIRHYTVAWRDRNVTASVAINGFEGRVGLADAVRLARAQERRISAS
jgi:hypothetical protein